MLKHLEKYNIILGSSSPRRLELFKQLNVPFKVKTKNTDETVPTNIYGAEIATHLAKRKSDAFDIKDNTMLITADTIVWYNGVVYSKPKNRKDAKKILRELSGNTHYVITGVCIRTKKKTEIFHSKSRVKFAKLTDKEIDYYVKNFNPTDKAGAYGIQEWIGIIGIKKIEGSYFNVIGLPTQKLYKTLKKFDK